MWAAELSRDSSRETARNAPETVDRSFTTFNLKLIFTE